MKLFASLLFMCILFATTSLFAQTEILANWEPQVAGKFYPGNKEALKDQIEGFLKNTESQEQKNKPFAIISPHAGYIYSGQVAAHAYNAIQQFRFKRVIILAPSHKGRRYRGAALLNARNFQTPLGPIPVDQEACKQLLNMKTEVKSKYSHTPLKLFGYYEGAYKGEHSLETQLPFLKMTLNDFKIVPILISVLKDEDFDIIAEAIKPLIDENTLLVVSSDFTHYGDAYRFVPFRNNIEENIKKLDYGAFEKIISKDFDGLKEYKQQTGINACGILPVAVLLKLLPEGVKGELLNYDTSGHKSNNFTYSVSYASIVFTKTSNIKSGQHLPSITNQDTTDNILLNNSEKSLLLTLARNTLETYIQSGNYPTYNAHVNRLTPRLKEKYGVFVTLKKFGELRGCIGYILPRKPLYQAVIENTINSSARDRRFLPVHPKEVSDITIEISVLSLPRKINNSDDFWVGKEGIVIRKGAASAVFLPHVATEQGWDKTETLQHLCRKAGLPLNAWKEGGMEFFVFTADVFHEERI